MNRAFNEFSKYLHKRICITKRKSARSRYPPRQKRVGTTAIRSYNKQEEVVRREIRAKVVQLEELMVQLSRRKANEPSQFIMIG